MLTSPIKSPATTPDRTHIPSTSTTAKERVGKRKRQREIRRRHSRASPNCEMSTTESAVASTEMPSDGASQVSSTQSGKKKRKRNPRLTLAQMRGVFALFKHWWPPRKGKRMSKTEHEQRWATYKAKILHDYQRVIRGKFSSEKALIKRYSCPISWLKYRLKRHTNLDVRDLTPADREYYMEIVKRLHSNLQNFFINFHKYMQLGWRHRHRKDV